LEKKKRKNSFVLYFIGQIWPTEKVSRMVSKTGLYCLWTVTILKYRRNTIQVFWLFFQQL